jgi:hypothetical protein
MSTTWPELGICEILLDQGHYIGEDPVGHACCEPATRIVKLLHSQIMLYRVCETCFMWLQDAEKVRRMSVYAPFVGVQNFAFLDEVKSQTVIKHLKRQEAIKVRKCLRDFLLTNTAQPFTEGVNRD